MRWATRVAEFETLGGRGKKRVAVACNAMMRLAMQTYKGYKCMISVACNALHATYADI